MAKPSCLGVVLLAAPPWAGERHDHSPPGRTPAKVCGYQLSVKKAAHFETVAPNCRKGGTIGRSSLNHAVRAHSGSAFLNRVRKFDFFRGHLSKRVSGQSR
jgi:hypothetical protein